MPRLAPGNDLWPLFAKAFGLEGLPQPINASLHLHLDSLPRLELECYAQLQDEKALEELLDKLGKDSRIEVVLHPTVLPSSPRGQDQIRPDDPRIAFG